MKKDTSQNDTARKTSVIFDLEQRKVLLSASLVSILMLVSVLNENMMANQEDSGLHSRGVASLNFDSKGLQQQLDWEHSLAKRLAKAETDPKMVRDLSSIGHAPSPLDQLQLGILSTDLYSYTYSKDGKIEAISFPEASNERPRYITGRENFLEGYAQAFAVSFRNAEMVSSSASDEFVTETFKLFDAEEAVGQAVVKTDKFGRLYSVQVSQIK